MATELRVLVVEDEADTAESTATLLRLRGYDVCVVTDGPSALTAVDEYRPDVVLLDIGLPGMDGHEVSKRLTLNACGRKPLLIATTGRGSDADLFRSSVAGIDLHLVKPVAPTELEDVLSHYQDMIAAKQPLDESALG